MRTDKPRIAVVYATAQGSTREIALFIAEELRQRGAEVEVADIEHTPELANVDAVVLGSAVHNRALLPAVAAYVRSNRKALAAKPTWLFSVGIGPALVGPIGRRLGRAVPPRIAAVRDAIAPCEYQAFAGHYERAGVDLGARIVFRLTGGPRYGDLRDWSAICSWANTIGTALNLPATANSTVQP